ncbi:hypothetical protein TRFO_21710 [Tritrichomonas foetus]|uniref:Uncharacterized protein n=1 Tax=Tritrichomonas foetus TaxID=1144522 RepID=A0A1J4KHT8_9EUKA|nr:hypothetical protein TRFO_21710 [Tritrichomonas foetus]|eukprot:OHT09388.1 hypothetical protein TRFO_21710 [Tritrichomonas foetus]
MNFISDSDEEEFTEDDEEVQIYKPHRRKKKKKSREARYIGPRVLTLPPNVQMNGQMPFQMQSSQINSHMPNTIIQPKLVPDQPNQIYQSHYLQQRQQQAPQMSQHNYSMSPEQNFAHRTQVSPSPQNNIHPIKSSRPNSLNKRIEHMTCDVNQRAGKSFAFDGEVKENPEKFQNGGYFGPSGIPDLATVDSTYVPIMCPIFPRGRIFNV